MAYWKWLQGFLPTLISKPKEVFTIAVVKDRHDGTALPYVASGSYAGEHWLAFPMLYMRCRQVSDYRTHCRALPRTGYAIGTIWLY